MKIWTAIKTHRVTKREKIKQKFGGLCAYSGTPLEDDWLAKLPNNPRVERSKKRKDYLLKVAAYFGVTPENPFPGKFHFECFK